MNDEGFGDWRIFAVTTLAEDIPPAYPDGPSHKAGAPIYLVTESIHKEFNSLGFITPSAVALALNISLNSSKEANKLRNTLALEDVHTPNGKGKQIAKQNIPILYDFFEKSMIAVTFAFQAIEVFANWHISKEPNRIIEAKWKKKIEALRAYEIERTFPTTEKISQILPLLLECPSPKGGKIWQDFMKLKQVRDSTIHLKHLDMYPGLNIDHESLFYQFLNHNIFDFPQYSFNTISYFISEEAKPRWATLFHEKIKSMN